MSLTLRKRRVEIVVPRTRLDRIKVQATRAARKVGPMADGARDVAVQTIDDARVWAAPRLERAAHSVEERIAPRVSALLSDAAKAVDPGRTVKTRRRWPIFTLFTGLALGAIGWMMYRNNRQWVDSMKETGADAGSWAADKAAQTSEKAAVTSEKAAEASERLAETSEKPAEPGDKLGTKSRQKP